MAATVHKLDARREDPAMLRQIERDTGVQEARRRLAEALFEVAAGIMVVARQRVGDLIARDVSGPFTAAGMTARDAIAEERQAQQLVNQAEGNASVAEIAQRIAEEYEVTTPEIRERVIDIAQAIFKAMMRVEAERLALLRKAKEAEEAAETEVGPYQSIAA